MSAVCQRRANNTNRNPNLSIIITIILIITIIPTSTNTNVTSVLTMPPLSPNLRANNAWVGPLAGEQVANAYGSQWKTLGLFDREVGAYAL